MQTLVVDSGIFTEVSRSSRFPLILVEAPRNGQVSGRVTLWIAPGFPYAQVGLRCAFRQAFSGLLPAVFTIKLLAEPSRALLPLVHSDGHTTNAVGVIS
jgi:hypothetical protein